MKVQKVMYILIGCMVLLSACSEEFARWSADDALEVFQENDLLLEEGTTIKKEELGHVPEHLEEAFAFSIPSVEEQVGGKVFSFTTEESLNDMKDYFGNLEGEADSILTKTIQHDNLLVVLNENLTDKEFHQFKDTLQTLE
ncbi:hypothetical protein GWK91_08235 [Virgibacillus sp. MSP4-1]|uniref:hypothetical protein n=1 Tax=Virgibacillus sp. MSP4-1 TaxID=2700081 RepID=UPI0003A0D4E8|nr:hypothetical protein [Virgibacillus sp. MSP4-1]QHS22934.1 hypothetical protein GWK91_08235 [Virgibacillus sp. MSP4-1]